MNDILTRGRNEIIVEFVTIMNEQNVLYFCLNCIQDLINGLVTTALHLTGLIWYFFNELSYPYNLNFSQDFINCAGQRPRNVQPQYYSCSRFCFFSTTMITNVSLNLSVFQELRKLYISSEIHFLPFMKTSGKSLLCGNKLLPIWVQRWKCSMVPNKD